MAITFHKKEFKVGDKVRRLDDFSTCVIQKVSGEFIKLDGLNSPKHVSNVLPEEEVYLTFRGNLSTLGELRDLIEKIPDEFLDCYLFSHVKLDDTTKSNTVNRPKTQKTQATGHWLLDCTPDDEEFDLDFADEQCYEGYSFDIVVSSKRKVAVFEIYDEEDEDIDENSVVHELHGNVIEYSYSDEDEIELGTYRELKEVLLSLPKPQLSYQIVPTYALENGEEGLNNKCGFKEPSFYVDIIIAKGYQRIHLSFVESFDYGIDPEAELNKYIVNQEKNES